MAENKMKEVAKLLGIEMYVPFYIKNSKGVLSICNPCMLRDDFLYDSDNHACPMTLNYLLNGVYEIERPVLDDVEKRYLEGVLRPFKDRVVFVEKMYDDYSNVHEEEEYIEVSLKHHNFEYEDTLTFPFFKKDTMYKGMTPNKKYTLKELGLFEDEI